MWILRSIDATLEVTMRLLPGAMKTVGRGTAADFIVDKPLVSRLHCNLAAAAGELTVEDLDSTNGTFVNGRRVQRSALREGNLLRLGDVELLVTRE
jgi:pSer/pThr/pTyr-binding forkhead associated (FHA) protein